MSNLKSNSAGVSQLVWTAGIVAGASLPHWTSLPVWSVVLMLVCIGWRFAIRLLRWPRPGPWTLRLITLLAFAGVWLQFDNISGLAPGTALLVVMVSLKFLEARSQRDHMVLTVIAYFLVFTSLLSGGGVVRVLYLIAFVWITTVGLVQLGRRGSLLPHAVPARLALRQLLQSAPFMVLLFVAFPRLSGPLWSMPADGSRAVTGLSGSMSPGDITELGLSDAIAFRVEFSGELPAASELYWRGPVLTEFDGRRWTASGGNRSGSRKDAIEYQGLISNYTVTLDVGARGWLFALDMPQDWSQDVRGVSIVMHDNYQLMLRSWDPTPRSISYAVTSHSRYQAREKLDASLIERFTDLPEDMNPRTRALMAKLTADSPDPRTLIDRALNVFAGDEFYYTLTPPALGTHTADEFIFDTKEGFCEHYASAFAIMMRIAGLPARIVTGYQGGELNPYGGYHIVRQANAHAWTEVWLENEGWVRVDPIATVSPERISVGSSRTGIGGNSSLAQRIGRMTLLRQLALTWDAVDTFWNRWIVNFGPRLQRDLFEKLGLADIGLRKLLLITVLVTTVLMTSLVSYFGFRMRHWQGRQDPATRMFRAFGRKLATCSVEPRRPGEAPTAYARRAATVVPEAAESIDAIAQAYLAARYEPDPAGAALATLTSLVRAFNPRYVRASR